ncbi:MAG: ATP-binding cassette domain-containing protein, partial [Syntrophobacteraceae bacterium]
MRARGRLLLSGETTLINVLSGISKADSGSALLSGRPIQALPPHRIASLGVARTFQNIRLFPAMTCLENVIAGQHLTAKRPLFPRLVCLPAARREERQSCREAREYLARVGIENRAEAPANSLSYGERRLLEIARALALKPRLLLLDEPVAGMHKLGRERIDGLLRSLAREGMGILLIEHNMTFVMRLCSKVTVINFGQTITTGTPEEVGRHPDVIEAYLGGPERSSPRRTVGLGQASEEAADGPEAANEANGGLDAQG